MNTKKYYKEESVNIGLVIMFIFGVLIGLSILYIWSKDPSGWAPNGIYGVLGFISIWLTMIGIFWHFDAKKAKRFLARKANIINNGLKVQGVISDKKDEVQFYTDSDGDSHVSQSYYLKVNFKDGDVEKEFWTPELSFNPKKLTSAAVDVYIYNNDYFVDNFITEKQTYNPTAISYDPYNILVSDAKRKSSLIWTIILAACYLLFFPTIFLEIYINNNIIKFNIVAAFVATVIIFNVLIFYTSLKRRK